MNVSRSGVLARRFGAAGVDWGIEIGGGLLGSYFGVMTAALWLALKNVPAESMQSSMWHGLGFGFAFWGISVSFINRVLIQGVSRASIGKKLFKLELISSGPPLSWTLILKRWVLSYFSLAIGGIGYVYCFFEENGRTLHDLVAGTDVIPLFKSASMSVEFRDEVSVVPIVGLRTHEISKMIVLANNSSERPSATVIHLPIRTEPVPAFQATPVESTLDGRVTLAEVIELIPDAEKKDKKAA